MFDIIVESGYKCFINFKTLRHNDLNVMYETYEMTEAQANGFEKWFNSEIGTDIERNCVDYDTVYFVITDITSKEWNRCSAVLTFITSYSQFIK